jgi:hypothetical protein
MSMHYIIISHIFTPYFQLILEGIAYNAARAVRRRRPRRRSVGELQLKTGIVIYVFCRYVIFLPPLIRLAGAGKHRLCRDKFRDMTMKINKAISAAGKYGIACLLRFSLPHPVYIFYNSCYTENQ